MLPSQRAWNWAMGRVGKRLIPGLGRLAGWEGGEAPHGEGSRCRALLQDSSLLPQRVEDWEPGLEFAHHPASCFFQPTPPDLTVPWEAPKPSFPI